MAKEAIPPFTPEAADRCSRSRALGEGKRGAARAGGGCARAHGRLRVGHACAPCTTATTRQLELGKKSHVEASELGCGRRRARGEPGRRKVRASGGLVNGRLVAPAAWLRHGQGARRRRASSCSGSHTRAAPRRGRPVPGARRPSSEPVLPAARGHGGGGIDAGERRRRRAGQGLAGWCRRACARTRSVDRALARSAERGA